MIIEEWRRGCWVFREADVEREVDCRGEMGGGARSSGDCVLCVENGYRVTSVKTKKRPRRCRAALQALAAWRLGAVLTATFDQQCCEDGGTVDKERSDWRRL